LDIVRVEEELLDAEVGIYELKVTIFKDLNGKAAYFEFGSLKQAGSQ